MELFRHMRVDQQLRSFECQLLEAHPQSPCSRRNRLEAGRTVPVESRFKTFLAFVLVEKFFTSIHLKTSRNSTVVEKFILETIFFSEYSSSWISAPEILLRLYLVHSHQWVVSTGCRIPLENLQPGTLSGQSGSLLASKERGFRAQADFMWKYTQTGSDFTPKGA